jgi:hypothetical protein
VTFATVGAGDNCSIHLTLLPNSTGDEFEDEDEYLRSLKLDDVYSFSYPYEYVADRFGDGDDDVTLETATLTVLLVWDDSPAPGYEVSASVDSPTPIPNEWTGDATEIFSDLWSDIAADSDSYGIGPELRKNWPFVF